MDKVKGIVDDYSSKPTCQEGCSWQMRVNPPVDPPMWMMLPCSSRILQWPKAKTASFASPRSVLCQLAKHVVVARREIFQREETLIFAAAEVSAMFLTQLRFGGVNFRLLSVFAICQRVEAEQQGRPSS